MTTYSGYTETQNSNLPWASSYPAHWRPRRVRFLLDDGHIGLKIGPFGSQIKLQTLTDSGFKIYGQENIINRDFELGQRYLSPEAFEELRVYEVKEGDALVTMMGTSGRCEIVPSGIQSGIMDSHLVRLRTNHEICRKFLRYLIDESSYVRFQIELMGKGSIMHGLNSSIIKSLNVLLPLKSEQTQIVKFLDWKTGQIDALIARKQELLEKLKEKRIAVITQAVTQGLNPAAPMRDSGIPWLGQVPQHWEVKRLKWAVMLQRGHDLPAEERVDGDVPIVTSSGISAFHDCAIAKAPGIVTGRYGTIGVFHLIDRDYWPLNTTLYSNDLHGNCPRFLRAMLENIAPLFLLNSVKSAVPGVDRNDVLSIPVALPQHDEQSMIADYIDAESFKIGQMSEKVETAINLLTEYRTALITAATTGTIDVRNVSIGSSA